MQPLDGAGPRISTPTRRQLTPTPPRTPNTAGVLASSSSLPLRRMLRSFSEPASTYGRGGGDDASPAKMRAVKCSPGGRSDVDAGHSPVPGSDPGARAADGAETDKGVRFEVTKLQCAPQSNRVHPRHRVRHGRNGRDGQRLSLSQPRRSGAHPAPAPKAVQQRPSTEGGRQIRVRRGGSLGLVSEAYLGNSGGGGGLPQLAATHPAADPTPLPGILKLSPPPSRPTSAAIESDKAMDAAEDARVRALALQYEVAEGSRSR